MSAVIDPARSNGPWSVIIAGSAPGTKGDEGDPGVGIQQLDVSADGQTLIVWLTDGSQKDVPLSSLLEVVSTQSSGAVDDAVKKYVLQLDGKLDADAIYAEADGTLRLVPKAVGVLPPDVRINGGVYQAGATPLPAGLSLNADGVTIMTDGTVYFPHTIDNNGVLCAAGA